MFLTSFNPSNMVQSRTVSWRELPNGTEGIGLAVINNNAIYVTGQITLNGNYSLALIGFDITNSTLPFIKALKYMDTSTPAFGPLINDQGLAALNLSTGANGNLLVTGLAPFALEGGQPFGSVSEITGSYLSGTMPYNGGPGDSNQLGELAVPGTWTGPLPAAWTESYQAGSDAMVIEVDPTLFP